MTESRLNAIIHAPNRLQICAFLTPLQEAEFQLLRDELGVSDSVLSKHLKQLEEAGYVAFRKSAVNGRQRMWAGLTKSGRKAFSAHVEELSRIAGVVVHSRS
jgi:DNA-binding MarR family transcriptional regulator